MSVRLDLSPRELAYLLGCVGGMLRQPGMPPGHRAALVTLRDRLAPHLPLDPGLEQALGLTPAVAGRLQ